MLANDPTLCEKYFKFLIMIFAIYASYATSEIKVC